jgi:predicted ATPase
MTAARALGAALRLGWEKRVRRGFFLRAEDFFNFAQRLKAEMAELAEYAEEYDETLSGYGRQLARGTVLGQRQQLVDTYGEHPDAQSHGESFLALFQQRFSPGGIYLLDEPEAALSPQRQLALLSMLLEMVREQDGQFIVATHSPILMACPEATIYSFDTVPPAPTAWAELEHVTLMRAFLNAPESFVQRL